MFASCSPRSPLSTPLVCWWQTVSPNRSSPPPARPWQLPGVLAVPAGCSPRSPETPGHPAPPGTSQTSSSGTDHCISVLHVPILYIHIYFHVFLLNNQRKFRKCLKKKKKKRQLRALGAECDDRGLTISCAVIAIALENFTMVVW